MLLLQKFNFCTIKKMNLQHKYNFFSPSPFYKGAGGIRENHDFKQNMLVGEFFSVWGTYRGWLIFLMSFKNNLSILTWGHVQNIILYSYYVIIDHHVIHDFYIFLLPLSRIASSWFPPIFTIGSMQKYEHKVKGKRFSN